MCVPSNAATLVVYYNVAHLRKAGLPPPPPNWSWADFQRYAKAMTSPPRADGRIEVYGFGVERLLIRIAPLVWSAGGEIVDSTDKPTRLSFDSPQAAEAINFYRSFLVNGHAPALAESKSEEYEARFARGGLAMTFNSRRFTPILRAVPGLEWDVAPLPVGARPATSLHSDGYCVAKSSPNKDVAVRFVEFAAGPAGSAILARGGRIVPALKSVAASPDFLDPSKLPKSSKVFLDVLAHARRTPNVAPWNEVETRAEAIVADWYFDLNRTPADLARALDAVSRPILAGGGR
jgi:multiple sugar transport system substrate-binding protein